jgi:poly(3-hydroxybutyrate) depolymerase
MRYASPFLASLAAAYGPGGGDRRPALMLDQTSIGGHSVAVAQRCLVERPFCRLIHLDRDIRRDDPRLLVVAPLSGHFLALLRDLLAALVLDHDVYVTDWVDAREVPVECGDFDVGDNIGYVLDFVRYLGGSLHLLGVCQSAMPVLAATALLAQDHDLAQPRSITLINGMLDTHSSRRVSIVSHASILWIGLGETPSPPSPWATPAKGASSIPLRSNMRD